MIRFSTHLLGESLLGKTGYIMVGMLPCIDAEGDKGLRPGIMMMALRRHFALWWGHHEDKN